MTSQPTTTRLQLSHGAGGHLAAWAAARGRHDWPEKVAVTRVISQAGVLDQLIWCAHGTEDPDVPISQPEDW